MNERVQWPGVICVKRTVYCVVWALYKIIIISIIMKKIVERYLSVNSQPIVMKFVRTIS